MPTVVEGSTWVNRKTGRRVLVTSASSDRVGYRTLSQKQQVRSTWTDRFCAAYSPEEKPTAESVRARMRAAARTGADLTLSPVELRVALQATAAQAPHEARVFAAVKKALADARFPYPCALKSTVQSPTFTAMALTPGLSDASQVLVVNQLRRALRECPDLDTPVFGTTATTVASDHWFVPGDTESPVSVPAPAEGE